MKTELRQLGDSGEELAAEDYERRGYEILARQYAVRGVGEADIVCRRGGELVFVEVKTRRTRRFGAPEDAVTEVKRRRLRRVAQDYIARSGCGESCRIRFDVAAITKNNEQIEINVIENAF